MGTSIVQHVYFCVFLVLCHCWKKSFNLKDIKSISNVKSRSQYSVMKPYTCRVRMPLMLLCATSQVYEQMESVVKTRKCDLSFNIAPVYSPELIAFGIHPQWKPNKVSGLS